MNCSSQSWVTIWENALERISAFGVCVCVYVNGTKRNQMAFKVPFNYEIVDLFQLRE